MTGRVVDDGTPTGAEYLTVRWTIAAAFPGYIYAESASGDVCIGKLDSHLLAADAVCAHNAILEVRPRG